MIINLFTGQPIITDRPVSELIPLLNSNAISMSDLTSSEHSSIIDVIFSALGKNGRCAMCDTCSFSDSCYKLRGINHE